jgi:hypothetical protein
LATSIVEDNSPGFIGHIGESIIESILVELGYWPNIMPVMHASTPNALAVVTEKVWASRRKHRDDQVAQ